MSHEVGTVIGDYQIVGVLGAGGMGKVYKVRNTISDRIEAMKVLLPNLDADHELAERFMREIKVQASLDHPNIAALRTAQRVGNQLVMIMEYIEGSTLEAIMRERRIPVAECANYVSQVLSALGYAHSHGIVHRDIKPANMMLTPQGVVKLMDFGIAKLSMDHRLTQTGKTVGSLFYMSPEQIRGDANLDPRSDLYSLGISFYEMVTGRRPFDGESDYSIMAAHLQQPPRPPVELDPSLPAVLNDIILISIAKDPTQRCQTADAFRAALHSVESGLGVGAAIAPGGTQLYSKVAPTGPHAAPTGPHTAPLPSPSSGRRPTVVELPPRPSQPGIQAIPQGQTVPMPQPPPPPRVPSQPHLQAFAPPQSTPLPYQPAPQFQPPQPQPFQPMPPRQAPLQQQGSGSHRGMYMVIGSLVTIGILIAAGLYLPKLWKTRASGDPQAQEQAKQQPQQPSGSTQLTPPPQQANPPQQSPQQETAQQQTPAPEVKPETPPAQQPSRPTPVVQQAKAHPAPRSETKLAQTPVQPPPQAPPPQTALQQQQPAPSYGTPQTAQPAMPQPGTPAGGNDPALQEVRQHREMMIPRIEAVNASMTDLQRQQASMGLGMSGDLIASQRRIQFFMDAATRALRNGNTAEARTALNNAERELDKLEKHFGR